MQVYKLNPGSGRNPAHFAPPDYSVFTFSGGSWAPAVPTAEVLERIFVYQPPPKLWNFRVTDGLVWFEVTGPPGGTLVVEYLDDSTFIEQPGWWKQLGTVSATGNFQPLTDQPGQAPRRFYRARL